MKNLKYIFTFFAFFALSSCGEDFLDVPNPEAISPDQSLAEITGYEGVMNSAYNRLIAFSWYGQNGMVAPDVLADNIDFANRTGRYEEEQVNAIRSHMARWGQPYRAINEANIIIGRINDLADLTAEEAITRDLLLGEAHFIRGLSYHDQARVYGYEPGQEVNGFNLTTELRLTPTFGLSDATNSGPRVTNTEMYAQIKSDLNESISKLTGTVSTIPTRADEGAARGILARVLLYEGSWAEAAAEAERALDVTPAELTTGDDYVASWGQPNHPESVFELDIQPVDWSTVDGANNSLSTITNDLFSGAQFILVASPELVSSFEAGDIRTELFTVSANHPTNPTKCNKWQGENGDFRENIPVMRTAELYLIAAEGYARSGNDSSAQAWLNMLREARGLPATSMTGNDLLDLIMNERRVEFAFEGHRWFDLKRLGMDIPKSAASGVSTIQYEDFRVLADLPVSELNLNDQLVQNPGY